MVAHREMLISLYRKDHLKPRASQAELPLALPAALDPDLETM